MGLFNHDEPENSAEQPGRQASANSGSGPAFSGLSGNEMYCVELCGWRTGDLLVGNSVFALGFIGGICCLLNDICQISVFKIC
jgi:hypothetical protein